MVHGNEPMTLSESRSGTSAAIIDSQSVKTTEKGGLVAMTGKKVNGRKRHGVLKPALSLPWDANQVTHIWPYHGNLV